MPTVSDRHSIESTSQPALNCELQVDGTSALPCTVQDLLAMLQQEFGSPCDGLSLDFGREGWIVGTQFSSPSNFKMMLDALQRVMQLSSISANEVTIVVDEEQIPLCELLQDQSVVG